MPILDAPLPRMAGRLSFMRAARKQLEDVNSGDLAVVGLPFEDINADNAGQSLAARGLRETSVYFGWHANPQFSHPVDVDDRKIISTDGIFEKMSDLGDLVHPPSPQGVAQLSETLGQIGARALYLGGTQSVALEVAADRPVISLGGAITDPTWLALAPLSGPGLAADPSRPVRKIEQLVDEHLSGRQDATVIFDLSVFSSSLSGLCDRARLGGCGLPEVALWMSVLGERSVQSVFLTGLNPTLSGMGIIKTGQRLMVTALLSYIYAALGAATSAADTIKSLEESAL